MSPWFETVTDLSRQADVLQRRRFGAIEVLDGRFRQIRLRPFPAVASMAGVLLAGKRRHAVEEGDRCLLYYNQPFRAPNYLAVVYAISSRRTTYRTFHTAARVLDEVARIKRSDALVCDIGVSRISDRLMKRWGWAPHSPQRWHRNFIKRFYGEYPPPFDPHSPDPAKSLRLCASV